jgi:hypothetical protein
MLEALRSSDEPHGVTSQKTPFSLDNRFVFDVLFGSTDGGDEN